MIHDDIEKKIVRDYPDYEGPGPDDLMDILSGARTASEVWNEALLDMRRKMESYISEAGTYIIAEGASIDKIEFNRGRIVAMSDAIDWINEIIGDPYA